MAKVSKHYRLDPEVLELLDRIQEKLKSELRINITATDVIEHCIYQTALNKAIIKDSQPSE